MFCTRYYFRANFPENFKKYLFYLLLLIKIYWILQTFGKYTYKIKRVTKFSGKLFRMVKEFLKTVFDPIHYNQTNIQSFSLFHIGVEMKNRHMRFIGAFPSIEISIVP